MPFEESVQNSKQAQDRKLGDEWLDWDGNREQNDTRTPAGVFLGLASLVVVGCMGLGWLVLWLAGPRLASLGLGPLIRIAAWLWTGYLGLWTILVLLAAWKAKGFNPLLRALGGIRWLLGPTIILGRWIGFSRDRVAHSYIITHNRLESFPPRIQNPEQLLILAPRCLNREAMAGLKQLRERYGFYQSIAVGGTEARKVIAERRPRAIIAIACERDLWVGIKDVRGRIPVRAFPIRRPEGPCRNTEIDLVAIESAVREHLQVKSEPGFTTGLQVQKSREENPS